MNHNNRFFRACMSSIKDTSLDNGQYMTNSEIEVINFDKVKDLYVKDLGLKHVPCSIDAFCCHANTFIEFKNGNIKDKSECFKIRKKIVDSLLIFTDILNIGISYTRSDIDFILVYNKAKNNVNNTECDGIQESESLDSIVKKISELGKEDIIKFGLGDFKKYCFKNVYTYTQEEFEQKFLKVN